MLLVERLSLRNRVTEEGPESFAPWIRRLANSAIAMWFVRHAQRSMRFHIVCMVLVLVLSVVMPSRFMMVKRLADRRYCKTCFSRYGVPGKRELGVGPGDA